MIWRFIRLVSNSIVVLVLLTGCFQSDYTRLVKQELAKGVRHDSVLLGIRLGDSQKAFREKCFELNRKHMVTEGQGFWVQYLSADSLPITPKVKLLFFPTFDEKEILAGLDLRITYVGWAPWNQRLQSDSLVENIKPLLMKLYGGNEFVTAHVKGRDIPVKLDGNRRIMIYNSPPDYVVVRIQDILHPLYTHDKD